MLKCAVENSHILSLPKIKKPPKRPATKMSIGKMTQAAATISLRSVISPTPGTGVSITTCFGSPIVISLPSYYKQRTNNWARKALPELSRVPSNQPLLRVPSSSERIPSSSALISKCRERRSGSYTATDTYSDTRAPKSSANLSNSLTNRKFINP
jgi:hypothetical protein